VARSRQGLGLALTLAGVVIVADQVSKWLVRREADRLPYRLVGGLRVQVGSDVYDGSVRARLTELVEQF